MRCRNAHTSAIDGVAPGEVGDWNPELVKGLLRTGLLAPVDPGEAHGVAEGEPGPGSLRARFDLAWKEREERFAGELAAKDARLTELEVENAQLKLDLEAATAPSKPEG